MILLFITRVFGILFMVYWELEIEYKYRHFAYILIHTIYILYTLIFARKYNVFTNDNL